MKRQDRDFGQVIHSGPNSSTTATSFGIVLPDFEQASPDAFMDAILLALSWIPHFEMSNLKNQSSFFRDLEHHQHFLPNLSQQLLESPNFVAKLLIKGELDLNLVRPFHYLQVSNFSRFLLFLHQFRLYLFLKLPLVCQKCQKLARFTLWKPLFTL